MIVTSIAVFQESPILYLHDKMPPSPLRVVFLIRRCDANRYKCGSNAEVDYLAVRNGKIYPAEVKTGASGTLRSLHLMLETYPNYPEGIVLSTRLHD
jgi:hypothetical protein